MAGARPSVQKAFVLGNIRQLDSMTIQERGRDNRYIPLKKKRAVSEKDSRS
jgi:hypothetical protein